MILQPENRNCLSRHEILMYLDRKETLSEEERYAIESHITDCDLCYAALEGYAFLRKTDYTVFKERMGETDNGAVEGFNGFRNPEKRHKERASYSALKNVRKSAFHAETGAADDNKNTAFVAAEQEVVYRAEKRLEKVGNNRDRNVPAREYRKSPSFDRRLTAAGLLLLIIAGFTVFSVFFNKDMDLLRAFGTGKELVMKVRGSGGPAQQEDERIEKAVLLFEHGDFHSSGREFESLVTTEKGTNYSIAFFAGLSYLNAGDLNKGRLYLEKSVEKEHLFTDESYWYLARLYLEEGEPQKAKNSLRFVLHSDNAGLRDRAKKILRKM